MMFKVTVVVTAFIAMASSSPAIVKRSPNMPSPPMPPGMPSPPMSPPGMIIAAHEMERYKRQAPETTPPSRFVRQAETTPPSKRVARDTLFATVDMPKTIAQEAFYSKITTINGDK